MSVTGAYRSLVGVEGLEVTRDASLAPCTAYRIGGPADLLVCAHGYRALAHALRALADEGVPWVVLGRGSSILASDEGYRGCVVRLGQEFSRTLVEGDRMTAGAAVMLPQLVNESLSRELTGLESCVGIPGTVGGAVSTNAGSRHDWVGRRVRDVVTLRPGRGMSRYAGSEIEWGYRWCSLPPDEIILEVTLELTRSSKDVVATEMNRRLARRRAAQPMRRLCCGPVFRDPGERSAGALLDACDLKGMRVGGAHVCETHANLIVNEGHATARDVVTVMGRMHDAVQARFGVDLVPEVKFLGFEG